jgi:hypothetical protein
MLPGSTGLPSSQIQCGVKPVPVLANMLNVVCQTANDGVRPFRHPDPNLLP